MVQKMKQTFTKQALGIYIQAGVSSTLAQRDYKDATDLVAETKQRRYCVRRLTPLECCRLQGFPDWWEDGVESKGDSARYKMWGNGVGLPCVCFVLAAVKELAEGGDEGATD